MRNWIVAYDIPDDRRRLAVANALEDFGDRVQHSVFEVLLDDNDEFELLQARLLREIEPEEDKVRFYPLCNDCSAKVFDLGMHEAEPFDEPDVVIV